jgi:hypothetical protein
MMVMVAIRSKPAKAGHPPWGVIPILTVSAEAMQKFPRHVINGAIVSDGQHVGQVYFPTPRGLALPKIIHPCDNQM